MVTLIVAFLADFLPVVSIIHTKVKDHFVPDALFCIPAPLSARMASTPCPAWLTDIHIAQDHNPSL